ncbi:LysR family transcriptional regulator [Intestinibacillus massiliensis]|uniref:LysR family transcriptional regulator n=1 Tax=Intestinibacillus massiliensis TaxID=1871029 RepID=UPI000B357CA4|nr:LysR family transcriptional regulator [Intestinibacillus massiliensis]
MDLKELHYILHIARCGNLTRAANALYLTQPALSKFLKNLERQVGSPLFSRIGSQLVPTYIGKRYLDYAERMVAMQGDWRAECADLLGEEKGRLSVAIPLMRGSCIIPDILPRFYQKYPQVEVALLEEAHSIEQHLFSSRDIDLVIYNDTSPSKNLIHEELGREEIVLVMAKNHALARRGVWRDGCRFPWMDLSLAAGERFIMHPLEQTTGKLSAQLLGLAGIAPNLLLRTRNSDVAIRLAANGVALAFAPESYIRKIHFEEPPVCFSVGAPKTETTLFAIYQKGRYIPSYTRYFLQLVRDAMQPASQMDGSPFIPDVKA